MRDPELAKLLSEVENLSYEEADTLKPEEHVPPQAKKESSLLTRFGSLFVTVDEEVPSAEQTPGTPLSAGNQTDASSTTVRDMVAAHPNVQFDASTINSENGAGLADIEFSEIYRQANLDESGFTVDKLEALLLDPSVKDQPSATKSLILKMALKSQNIAPDVPVQNAIGRDRALDGYQQMLNVRVEETVKANTEAINRINEEVKAYLEKKNAEMDELRTEMQNVKNDAEKFADRKLKEEQKLSEIIAPILEGQPNPVTMS